MRYLYLFLGIAVVLSLNACGKDDNEDPTTDGLINTSWQATLHDDNPATNPRGPLGSTGNNQYYPWLDCHLNITFTFGKNDKFIVLGLAQ